MAPTNRLSTWPAQTIGWRGTWRARSRPAERRQPPPSAPGPAFRPGAASRSRCTRGLLKRHTCLLERGGEDVAQLCQHRWVGDQRGRDLDDRVVAIVKADDQSALE